jgi:hypothetical protein
MCREKTGSILFASKAKAYRVKVACPVISRLLTSSLNPA